MSRPGYLRNEAAFASEIPKRSAAPNRLISFCRDSPLALPINCPNSADKLRFFTSSVFTPKSRSHVLICALK